LSASRFAAFIARYQIMTVVAPESAERFVLGDVSWRYYQHTLEELNETHVRVNYLRGRMEFMVIGGKHERVKSTAGRLLEHYAFEIDLPITASGSVTCFREDVEAGLEPDECYYIATPPPEITEQPLDLSKDAPPDLAIEVDITSSSVPRESIYAALGVPEIWRYDKERFTPWHRQADGTYAARDHSLAFPDLPMVDFNRFVKLALTTSQHEAVKAFQTWLRSRPRPGQSGS
jgi:Uma2 family endonuclease